ncbi:MAG: hypothetical protein NC231_10950 [Bacillus sp. (in: Bacteria)]|nr:hypothetical protein [Bacillus sp. (in: firmicutes)]MCM1427332.1 hypothetical protein [Eubacterium sp.]
MPSENFDPYNQTSLDEPAFVLRDSLGFLAVQVLSSKKNLSQMNYHDMLNELLEIISNLHNAYDEMN